MGEDAGRPGTGRLVALPGRRPRNVEPCALETSRGASSITKGPERLLTLF